MLTCALASLCKPEVQGEWVAEGRHEDHGGGRRLAGKCGTTSSVETLLRRMLGAGPRGAGALSRLPTGGQGVRGFGSQHSSIPT